MRTKFFAFLLTGMLGATLLSGCADDWDEELTEEVSAEYENTEYGSSKDGGADNEDLELGSGLEAGTAEGALDENPTRSIRRKRLVCGEPGEYVPQYTGFQGTACV